jgi:hypothetical protein
MFIPGSALNANLERQGTDLSITNNGSALLHLDTAQDRVGIGLRNPQAELHVVGNLIANSSILSGSLVADTVDGFEMFENGVRVLTQGDLFTLTGDVSGSGTYDNLSVTLSTSGVTSGTYGSTTTVPVIAVDTDGRITSAEDVVLTRIGNLLVVDTTVTSNTGTINFDGEILSGIGNAVSPTDAVNMQFLENYVAVTAGHPNIIEQGTSNVEVFDDTVTQLVRVNIGNVTMVETGSVGTSMSGTTTLGNVTVTDSVISVATLNANLTVSANGLGLVEIAGSTALGLPVGGTSTRPTNVSEGYIRYNLDANQLEFYNGVNWVLVQNSITDQSIVPDGITNTFELTNSNTTTVGALVSINGTIQIPGVAYIISGNLIIFAETPLATDLINIRIIGASTNVASLASASGNNSVTVDPAGVHITGPMVSHSTQVVIFSSGISTLIDEYDASVYRTSKYIVQATTATDSESYEFLVTHNGVDTAYLYMSSMVNTTGNALPSLGSVTAVYAGGAIQLEYTASNSNTAVRVCRLYIPT